MDGAHAAELLFTPAIDRDIHALFLQQIADSDPLALHIVIQDQAGFHLPQGDARIPANLRLLPLPAYSPELNPVERFGGLLKAQVGNRLHPTLRKLEDHLAAAATRWTTPAKVAGLIHAWLAAQANAGAPIYSLLTYRRWYESRDELPVRVRKFEFGPQTIHSHMLSIRRPEHMGAFGVVVPLDRFQR